MPNYGWPTLVRCWCLCSLFCCCVARSTQEARHGDVARELFASLKAGSTSLYDVECLLGEQLSLVDCPNGTKVWFSTSYQSAQSSGDATSITLVFDGQSLLQAAYLADSSWVGQAPENPGNPTWPYRKLVGVRE
jgi:hypothetical protein